MPFLAPVVPALIGAAKVAAPALISAAAGKALGPKAPGGGGAGSVAPTDPRGIANLASEQARRNIMESIGLEQEFTPGVAAAREGAMSNILKDIGGTGMQDLEMRLMGELGRGDLALEMPELQKSQLLESARAKALEDLDLGFALPKDVANLVARTAAGRTAGAGTMGGMGRDIAARDLGLTSLDIFDRRMDRAAGLGTQEEATNIGQQGLAANIASANRAFADARKRGIIGDVSRLRQQDFANRFGLAQFTQGIQRPTAGLDPGALADISVAGTNMQNQLAAQAAKNALAAKTAQGGMAADMFGSIMKSGILSNIGRGRTGGTATIQPYIPPKISSGNNFGFGTGPALPGYGGP